MTSSAHRSDVLLIQQLLYATRGAEAAELADNQQFLTTLLDSAVVASLLLLSPEQLEMFAAAANTSGVLRSPRAWARCTADGIRQQYPTFNLAANNLRPWLRLHCTALSRVYQEVCLAPFFNIPTRFTLGSARSADDGRNPQRGRHHAACARHSCGTPSTTAAHSRLAQRFRRRTTAISAAQCGHTPSASVRRRRRAPAAPRCAACCVRLR